MSRVKKSFGLAWHNLLSVSACYPGSVRPYSQVFHAVYSTVSCGADTRLNGLQFHTSPFPGHPAKQKSCFTCSLQTLQHSCWTVPHARNPARASSPCYALPSGAWTALQVTVTKGTRSVVLLSPVAGTGSSVAAGQRVWCCRTRPGWFEIFLFEGLWHMKSPPLSFSSSFKLL